MPGPIVLVGSPTALGGHFGGMERTPCELRAAGIVSRLAGALGPGVLSDAGDAPNDPGWAADADTRAKNRALIASYLPRLADHTSRALRDARPDARLIVLGGDCTSHGGALAGLRRHLTAFLGRPPRLAIAWFDAHGDFNTPDTTPSGNVWGMPFAMICGRGGPDLVGACDGPLVDEEDAALLGGQVLDETESRMLAASPIAHFGAGMLGTPAGMSALDAWAAVVGERVDGLYVAFDLDAIDASEGLSLAMPEPGGMSLDTAVDAVAVLAARAPIAGFGATAAMARPGLDLGVTVEAIVRLAGAALPT
jgi:arginase